MLRIFRSTNLRELNWLAKYKNKTNNWTQYTSAYKVEREVQKIVQETLKR
jgi:hypothetical protein